MSIGRVKIKNRIAVPPMIVCEGTPEGWVSPESIYRYRTLAEGGAGLVIVEGVMIDTPEAKGNVGAFVATESNMHGLSDIAKEISYRGSVPFVQVLHCGRQSLPAAINNLQPIAPSAIPYYTGKYYGAQPREATLEDLELVKQKYIDAVKVLVKAGYKGVEIHCAHGYLLATFLSAKSNQRKDKYGGDFEARMRYPLEVVKAIREAVPEVVVGARISARYLIPGEPTLEEMTVFAKELEKLGIDYLHVSGGTYESHYKQSPPCYYPRNVNVPEAAVLKKEVSIPIIVAGGITVPEEAADIVSSGQTDMVAMGRALFADPELPNKMKAGNEEEIRPCIRCNLEFKDSFNYQTARCSVNFRMSRERDYQMYKAPESKKLMIVGGGAGGMEAARVAALRGHEVYLYEKEAELGGNLIVAGIPDHKEEIRTLLTYFKNQMKKPGIHVELNTEVDQCLINKVNPDALIISTGAVPVIPPIPGVDDPNVITGEDYLINRPEVGDKVLIAGGGCVGIDLVYELTKAGKKVVLVERVENFGQDLDIISWGAVNLHFQNLVKEGKLEILLATSLVSIKGNDVVISDADGKESVLKVDKILLALGYKPNQDIVDELDDSVPMTRIIGDAEDARRIRHAIHEGFVSAYSL